MRAASMAQSKQSEGVDAAITGSGDSPWRPYSAISRSAASVLVGMPVEGPAPDVHHHERQLVRHGKPDRLGLQVHPRAARGRHAELARERGAERHVHCRDLVLRLDRAHAELVVARQRVQHLEAGVIG